jgi:hypothetical protein
VPSVFVVTGGGSGLELGDVNVMVLPPIPILVPPPEEVSVSFPVTVTLVPQVELIIEFNASADVCWTLLARVL